MTRRIICISHKYVVNYFHVKRKIYSELKQEKKQLKKQLAELPKLEVGKWITDKSNNWDSMLFITGLQGECFTAYGLDCKGNWTNNTGSSLCSYRPATDKEVETALIKEAKKRGFKEGVKYKNNGGTINKLKSNNFIYEYVSGVGMTIGTEDIWFYSNGKWAEIIEEPKTVTLNGEYNRTQLTDILNNQL